MLICYAFHFRCVMTFTRYIRGNFKLGLLDCVRYIGDLVIPGFVISGFCSIHFTVTLAGLKNIVRHSGDFVTKGSLYRGSARNDQRILWSTY